MGTECSGDALRVLAPRWSLAGDEKLLNILQNTHKKIITKCQEVNSKLEQMTAELDETSISLQNVNNKFMALSNSQFIESRVYEDDADISTDTVPAMETPQKPHKQETDLEAIKNSLKVLQDLHESVTILKDSDTETDSDDEDGDRVVLKPKDLYSDRPLPYIIGSEAWKNSWHAGLIPEDSDSESGSAGREPPSPQYSDSEPEDTQVASKANATISETSSDIASEQDTPVPPPMSTPADIAADLARRLGGQQPRMKEPEPEYSPPKIVSKTIYKPQQPQTGTIFTDEPPPLDSQSESSEEDDIFAELHTSRPENTRVVEDLFGGRMFADEVKIAPQPRNEQKPLFKDDPDEFEDRSPPVQEIDAKTTSKKPVGGISLFGTNKGAESIGAAILKRNQLKSTSEEETDSEECRPPPKPKTMDQTDSIKKEKDIFDDLFARSANFEKKKQVEKNKTQVKSVANDKVDLFSDNLFDDVNDLFTSNVMKNKGNKKSIFEDDDDDDLFADIAVSVNNKVNDKNNEAITKNNKSIFDSDDELFSDKTPVTNNRSKESAGANPNDSKSSSGHKNFDKSKEVKNFENPITSSIVVSKSSGSSQSNIKSTKITENIFDSDSDSDIFGNLVTKDIERKQEKKDIFDVKEKLTDVEDIFKQPNEIKNNPVKIGNEISKMRSPSLFDDDEEDELFGETVTKDVQNMGALRESAIGATDILFSEKDEKSEISIPEKNDSAGITVPSYAGETITEATEDFCIDKNDICKKTGNDTPIVPSDSDNNQKVNILENKENKQNDSNLIFENKVTNVQDDELFMHYETKSELERNKPLPSIEDDIVREEDSLIKVEKDTISKDIFHDDEPPEFEKPKEPKRSKNVNALFDDDSEDEALFFRKSDIEDKSEHFGSATKSDRLFGIFHDEPPAIDNFEDDSDIFSTLPKSSLEDGNAEETNNATEKFNDFENIPPSKLIYNIPESEVDHTNVSILQTESTTKQNNDFNDILKTEEPVSEIIENKNKPLNIHDAFSEIKEDEFDDIFKAANKIVNVNNDDVLEVTVDEFINNTKSQNTLEKLPDSMFNETGMSTSQLPEDVPASMKSGIEFDSDEELFRTLPKPEKPGVPEISHSDELDKGALMTENDKIDLSNRLKQDIFKAADKVEDTLQTSKKIQSENKMGITFEENVEHNPEVSKTEPKNPDLKKIGRIKSLNLNIDVSTLLPGASPKKQKVELPKDKDWEPMSDSTSEEVKQLTPENDSKMVKSISFEGEPNSEVLDNKLSKERARIQVKRRPSTRRARREAVRKSVIDFDDSTDNSSSIDDPPKTIDKSVKPHKTIDFKTVPNESSSYILNANVKDSKIDNKDTIISKINEDKSKDIEIASDTAPEKPKITSKVVYILNDEDIFDTQSKDKSSDMFKKDTPISTLGSMYGERSKTESKSKINDSSKKTSKVSIFGSDSEEELFGGKSKDKKKMEVKGSLFGDDDDDDLFGGKSTKADFTKAQTSKAGSKENEKSEPVFNDPLSMLGDDD